eukprot:COSAG02_NODE_12979_length_1465_cov_1.476574_3_plen_105_part_00
MAAGDTPALSLFPVLRAAVDCRLVVSATETVFGSGHDLRLFVSPSGMPYPVIPFLLLQPESTDDSSDEDYVPKHRADAKIGRLVLTITCTHSTGYTETFRRINV